jgi:AraC family ethanolamine operon transcriptional activator
MGQSTPIQVRRLESFEQLESAVRGAQRSIVQIGRGRMSGQLTHLSIGNLPVDLGVFSIGMRSTGILSKDRIAIGMLTGSSGRVTQWLHHVHIGDAMITPAGGEHDGSYEGGASFAVISFSPADIQSLFGSEPRLADLRLWKKNHFRAAPHAGVKLISRLHEIVAHLQPDNVTLAPGAVEFWKRSIAEIMTAAIQLNNPADSDRPLPSALKIVRKVEDYIDQAGARPVHISEICSKLNVSRRTLHRAFQDALGIGPVAFLQRRRLCDVHSAIRSGDPDTTTIAEIALQHGFLNLGRFSGYYRSLFGEYPSETFAQRACSKPMEPKRHPAFVHAR